MFDVTDASFAIDFMSFPVRRLLKNQIAFGKNPGAREVFDSWTRKNRLHSPNRTETTSHLSSFFCRDKIDGSTEFVCCETADTRIRRRSKAMRASA